jgi:hypothetical protein
MNKTMSAIFLLTVAVLAGCRQDVFPEKKEAIGNETDSTGPLLKPVQKEHDYLAFSSLESFNRVMEQLQNDKLPMAEFAKEFEGYRSMHMLQDSLQQVEVGSDNIWTAANIPDPYFRTVLSAEGRIRIADTLYQFEPGMEQGTAYAIPIAGAEALLKGQTSAAKIKGVNIYQTTMNLLPFPRWSDDPIKIDDPSKWEVCSFPSGFMFPWQGQKGGSIYHDDNGAELPRDNGRRIRIDYHRWRVGYVFYSSIGIRVKIWKDTRLGGWMSNIRMDKASMEGCARGWSLHPDSFRSTFMKTQRYLWTTQT